MNLQQTENYQESEKMGALGKTILLLAVITPPVGVIWAIVLLWNNLVNWTDILVLVLFYVVTICGVGVGFHRMLTHRSFEAKAPVRLFFLILGSMALQGPAIQWAATHLKHHAKSDKEGDPHSPLHGFWQAHVGWLFHSRFVTAGPWMNQFEGDRVAHFVDKTFYAWAILGFLIPGFIGWGIGGTLSAFGTGVLWGGLVRLFLVHHVTWSVNSVCHTFGRRRFKSNDRSRNEWIVGIMALGEGWHNNHHAFPKAAYHGMRWWQVDVNAYVIRFLKWIRLARKVEVPTREDMKSRELEA